MTRLSGIVGGLLAVLAPAPAVAADQPTGRVLVSLHRRAATPRALGGAVANLLARSGASRDGPTVPEIGLVTLSPALGEAPAKLVTELRGDPAVRAVTLERRLSLRAAPDDPALGASEPSAAGATLEWELQREGLYGAWDVTHADGATVGVIDTGVDGSHPELQGKLAATVSQFPGGGDPATDQNGHGTHVSGLACAATDNGVGIAGAGYNCRLVVEKSDFSDGSVAASIVDATNHGVQSLNMSFGSTPGRASVRSIADALDYAVEHGVVLVAAAGDTPDQEQGIPASDLQPAGSASDLAQGRGLVVTAANFADQRASFAGLGSEISLAAYGSFGDGASGPRGILSTFPGSVTTLETGGGGLPPLLPGQPPCGCRTALGGDNRYAYLEGTSMAAPQVAAIAALVRNLNPDMTALEVVRLLKQTARRPAGAGWEPQLGWGIVDANAAAAAARTVDHRAPSSRASAPDHVRGAPIPVRLTGSDTAPSPLLVPSGVDHIELYVSRDGGPFTLAATTAPGALSLPAQPGSRYAFYSLAVDRAGNREAAHTEPDAVTRVDSAQIRHRHKHRKYHRRRRRHRRHRRR